MNKLKKDSPNKWVQAAVMIGATLYQVGRGISQDSKRRKAESRARKLDKDLERQTNAMRDYDFRVQNPYEDIDVTTKAQEVAANQQTQQAADILANLAPIAGAGATASLATSIAKQGSASAAKLQGKMEQQEFQLQQRAAGAQLAIDRDIKQQEFNRDAALMNMQMYRAAGEYAQAAQYGQAASDSFKGAVTTGIQAAGAVDGLVDKNIEQGEEIFNYERSTNTTVPKAQEALGENSNNEIQLDVDSRQHFFGGPLYNDFPQYSVPQQNNLPQYEIQQF